MITSTFGVRHFGAALLTFVLCAGAADPVLAQQLPASTGRVNDFANVLDASAEADLDRVLQALEDKTTAELAVVTVPTLQGMSIEEYASRLFKQWGVGQEKVDNGVLVLVAPNERESRIEVGYGLEGVLPDGLTAEIQRTNFVPHFRTGDFAGGLQDGVTRLARLIEQKHVLTPAELRAFEAAAQDRPPIWLMVPFLGVFVTIGFYMLGVGFGSKTGFPVLFGSLFGGLPMIFSLIPFFNAPIWIIGSIALVMFVKGFRDGRKGGGLAEGFRMDGVAARSKRGWVMGGGSSSSGGSRSSSSSWSSGSSSSSSSGGSSSSFGGGSSGGGGSSSRW